MTCAKQKFCIHEKYCQRHIGQNFDSCILFSRNSKPMTEQEYLQSCNTEQLARFIFWQHFDVYGKTLYELMVNASRGVSRDKQAEVMIGAVVEWLKQPHGKENEK